MDTSKDLCSYYTLCRREDKYGNTIIEAGLRELMRTCLEFIEEYTQLQTNACNMGKRRCHIIVDHTPKCHPELPVKALKCFGVV